MWEDNIRRNKNWVWGIQGFSVLSLQLSWKSKPILKLKDYSLKKKKVVWKSSDSGMAEWGLNTRTTLQITTINWTKHKQQPPEGSGKWTKCWQIWEKNWNGTRHQHCMSFLLLRHQPEGRLQSNRGTGHLNWQNLRHSGLKHRSIGFGSATAAGTWGRKSQKEEYQRKEAPDFLFRLCPAECWTTHAWNRLKAASS